MSDIENVKKLREATGAGFKDCNLAIKESGGDIDKAIEILRVKGISKASKKMSRDAKEGVVAVSGNETKTSVIEVNCETDFVAKNEDFLKFANELTKAIHENQEINNFGSSENLSKLSIAGKDFNSTITDLISKIGENIQIISYKKYNSDNSIFISYLHNKYNSSCSKIASIVEISTDNVSKTIKIIDQLKVLAMQVSAMKPLSLDKESLEKKVLEEETDIILKQIENTPENKKEQILQGKLNKFIKENTLMGQALITDPKKNVSDYLSELSKSSNLDLNIVSMDLYNI